MHRKFQMLFMSLIVLCMCASVGYAQTDESSTVQPKHYGNVPYLSGGVGSDEREALSQAARDYNLKLSFAATSGNYLGDVAVEVRDSAGRIVLEAPSDGPWFFAKLPPGRYTVVVKDKEKSQTKTVQLSEKKQTVLNFFWQ
jgi:hypothetical protein